MNGYTVVEFFYMWDFQFSCDDRVCINEANFIDIYGAKM
jgi:hypothetical protein